MEGVEIKENLPQKGKGLFSCRGFCEGDILFEEQPLVCAQFPWNATYKYSACDHCLRSLETAEEQARRLAANPGIDLPHPECCQVNQQQHVQCPQCGVSYCSEVCRNSAFTQYHETLCLGASHEDPEHPINKLIEIWKNIHFPPETCSITLILRMIACVKQSKNKEEVIQRFSKFCRATENEQQQIAHKLLGKEFQGQLGLLRMQLSETMFEENLQLWYTPEGFQSLFAMIGTNGQGIGTSSVSVWVKNCEGLNLPEVDQDQLDQTIDALYEDMDKVSGTFLDCEGSGLYALQSTCNHNCEPNAEITFPSNNSKLAMKALKDIQPGEEICISYLDECDRDRSRHSRQKALRENYLFQCDCSKCLSQADDPDVTSEEDMDSDDEVVSY